MTFSLQKTGTALALVLLAANAAQASDDKYDRNIEAIVIAKAAEQVGEIRRSIDWDQPAAMVTRKQLLKAAAKETSLTPAKVWIPPKPENALPPMVMQEMPGLDHTPTASIPDSARQKEPKVFWEKFDSRGNPIP
jgi:hypothetical protein